MHLAIVEKSEPSTLRNLEQDVLFQNSGFFNILLEEPCSFILSHPLYRNALNGVIYLLMTNGTNKKSWIFPSVPAACLPLLLLCP